VDTIRRNLKDKFEITKKFDTTQGGREWFSNWDNGKQRELKAKSYDDEDKEFYVGAIHEGSIDGNGVLSYGGNNCRFYIVDDNEKPSKTWKNVEITVYGKRIDDVHKNEDFKEAKRNDKSKYDISQFRIAARSNHFYHPINDCPCSARSYFGEFNFNGKTYIRKEIAHPAYAAKKPDDLKDKKNWKDTPDNEFPKNKWIGMKVIVRNMDNDSAVRTEVYRDLTDGEDGGEWEKLMEFDDNGGWTAEKDDDLKKLKGILQDDKVDKDDECLDKKWEKQDPIVTQAAHSCYIRSNNIYEAQLKKFSVREIDPLP
jgi:hypothetical protein